MPPILAALIGAAVTLAAVVLVLIARNGRRRHQEAVANDRGPVLPPALRSFVDELPIAAALVGPHDELLHHNDHAERLGVVRGTRLGFDELLTTVRDARADGVPFVGPVVRRPRPGQERLELECRVAEIADRVLAVVAVDDEPTRRVEAVRRDFVTNVSHELKTPIGAISVLAEAVETAKDDPEAVQHFVGRLQWETQRLSSLVHQIIDLSRLQASDPLRERTVVRLDDVVREAFDNCRERAEARHVALFPPTSTAPEVIGDHRQLVDVVTNLLVNAITYSDEGARVAVSLGEAADDGVRFAELKVSDNGIGIPADEQERIFERFYRVDYARSRADGGTGLGLSIVRHIVLAHGGDISVWSAPGRGSTFTVRIPATNVSTIEEES